MGHDSKQPSLFNFEVIWPFQSVEERQKEVMVERKRIHTEAMERMLEGVLSSQRNPISH